MSLIGGGALVSSAKNVFVTRRARARRPDGTVFGFRKAFVSTTFDLAKWANARGYGDDYLDHMVIDGTIKKVLRAGKKGVGKQWYDNMTGWDRQKSKRVGLLTQKVGMRLDWDWWGRGHPVTILHVPDNHVRAALRSPSCATNFFLLRVINCRVIYYVQLLVILRTGIFYGRLG